MSGHGPDQASYDAAVNADLKPHKQENTMAFMFESRAVIRTTDFAMESPAMQLDYDDVWSNFEKGNPHS
ncbi:Homogentisate 1,2-dioxygenase [compost metagenome]